MIARLPVLRSGCYPDDPNPPSLPDLPAVLTIHSQAQPGRPSPTLSRREQASVSISFAVRFTHGDTRFAFRDRLPHRADADARFELRPGKFDGAIVEPIAPAAIAPLLTGPRVGG